jgi:hypothetical protein
MAMQLAQRGVDVAIGRIELFAQAARPQAGRAQGGQPGAQFVCFVHGPKFTQSPQTTTARW